VPLNPFDQITSPKQPLAVKVVVSTVQIVLFKHEMTGAFGTPTITHKVSDVSLKQDPSLQRAVYFELEEGVIFMVLPVIPFDQTICP
jgi:hypothetical protein